MAAHDVTGLVIHISSVNDRSTEVVMSERIRIGACEDCDVKIRLPQQLIEATAKVPVIELARSNGSYRVTSLNSGVEIRLNGKRIRPNAAIDDGDEVWIGPSGPSIHFFPVGSTAALVPGRRDTAHVAPFIEQAAMESSSTARRDDAKIFLREFTRELVREINPSTKILVFAILIASVLGALYIGIALSSEIRRLRKINDDLRSQAAAMNDQVSKTNEQLSDLDRSNKDVIRSLSLAVKLRSDYGSGVCLIAGSYIFVEAGTGRPLRYPETQTNESGGSVQSGNDNPVLTPEGRGPIAEYEFAGTGFYVGDGYVVTNRHVAQPWLADERAQSLNSKVNGQPRLKKFMAFFPDHPQPVTLKFKQAGQREDVAICTIDAKEIPPKLPFLPLEKEAESVAVGKPVVMMGYPNGPDRLLALLDESEARSIQARYSSPLASLGYLAEKKLIQPLTTQGNITDLDVRRIVYDARTAEGGSGAPLFGPSGRVIGVCFGIFTENAASNFAVPVRYATTLLERSGWKPPEAPEAEQGASTGQGNPKTATQR
ncbi:MAG TPA: trypsin-like peptidase domain-containing protein [Pyrinomonadaceae bacterium]|nr:trypsin-like peptidase domain-containing protein [Pyrinomonadaceae bacterium]